MNLAQRRSNYGLFTITRQIARRVQLEWEMVETPSPRPRFLDFPLTGEATPALPLKPVRTEKRPLAA